MKYYVLIYLLGISGTSLVYGAPTAAESKVEEQKPVLIAKRKQKVRKKYLTGEGRSKKSQSTNIDFEEASIDGRRRAPSGVSISSSQAKHGYDLINLRLRWHPEMIQSTSALETGEGR